MNERKFPIVCNPAIMNERKFFIAGVQFHPGAVDAIRNLIEGDELFLEPEPTNKFDSNAIKILDENNNFLGYVPKKISAEISAMIEIGEVYCMVETLNLSGKTWEICQVSITPIAEDETPEEAELEDLLNEEESE
jgi:hypothetical protein